MSTRYSCILLLLQIKDTISVKRYSCILLLLQIKGTISVNKVQLYLIPITNQRHYLCQQGTVVSYCYYKSKILSLSTRYSCILLLLQIKGTISVNKVQVYLIAITNQRHYICQQDMMATSDVNAGAIAKSAVDLPRVKVGLPYTDYKHCIRQYILSTWHDDWNGAVGNKRHSVRPVLQEVWNCLVSCCVSHTQLIHPYILTRDHPPLYGNE